MFPWRRCSVHFAVFALVFHVIYLSVYLPALTSHLFCCLPCSYVHLFVVPKLQPPSTVFVLAAWLLLFWQQVSQQRPQGMDSTGPRSHFQSSTCSCRHVGLNAFPLQIILRPRFRDLLLFVAPKNTIRQLGEHTARILTSGDVGIKSKANLIDVVDGDVVCGYVSEILCFLQLLLPEVQWENDVNNILILIIFICLIFKRLNNLFTFNALILSN